VTWTDLLNNVDAVACSGSSKLRFGLIDESFDHPQRMQTCLAVVRDEDRRIGGREDDHRVDVRDVSHFRRAAPWRRHARQDRLELVQRMGECEHRGQDVVAYLVPGVALHQDAVFDRPHPGDREWQERHVIISLRSEGADNR
jgi:hypothetical protein